MLTARVPQEINIPRNSSRKVDNDVAGSGANSSVSLPI